MTYGVIVHRAGKSWNAYVPELDGVVAVGASRERVIELISQAIPLHLRELAKTASLSQQIMERAKRSRLRSHSVASLLSPEQKELFSPAARALGSSGRHGQCGATDRNSRLSMKALHATRHSTACLLTRRRRRPRDRVGVLRHSPKSTTLNTYGHVLTDGQAKAVGTLSKRLGIRRSGQITASDPTQEVKKTA